MQLYSYGIPHLLLQLHFIFAGNDADKEAFARIAKQLQTATNPADFETTFSYFKKWVDSNSERKLYLGYWVEWWEERK